MSVTETGNRFASHKHRILIVDDNQDSALTLAKLLESFGHETMTCFDGAAAINASRRFRPNVILLDLSMPRLDGYEVCRQLRMQKTSVPTLIIALTGWADQSRQEMAKAAGFDAFFVKTTHDAQLFAFINGPKK